MTKIECIQDTIKDWDGNKAGNFLDFLLEKEHLTLDEWNDYMFKWMFDNFGK